MGNSYCGCRLTRQRDGPVRSADAPPAVPALPPRPQPAAAAAAPSGRAVQDAVPQAHGGGPVLRLHRRPGPLWRQMLHGRRQWFWRTATDGR